MKLRFQIPGDAHAFGPSADSLAYAVTFRHKGMVGKARLVGRVLQPQPLETENPDASLRFYQQIARVEITLSESQGDSGLRELVETEDKTELVKLIVESGNRCLSGYRYQGKLYNLEMLAFPKHETAAGLLEKWKVRVQSSSEGTWEPIVETDYQTILMRHMQGGINRTDWGVLLPQYLERIEEAIDEDTKPAPEDEFTTNAKAHLGRRNYRLALLEAVIGLEIVFTRFIKDYLKVHKGLSATTIKDFLTPDLTLSMRLAGVLPLTLSPSDYKYFDVGKVKKAVGWRNTITHKTGNLPDGLAEGEIDETVTEVFKLTYWLALRASQIAVSPKLEELASSVKIEHKFAAPSIEFQGNHCYFANFHYVTPLADQQAEGEEYASRGGHLNAEKAKAIVESLIKGVEKLDSRFQPEEHLVVTFTEIPFNRITWHWKKGKLQAIET